MTDHVVDSETAAMQSHHSVALPPFTTNTTTTATTNYNNMHAPSEVYYLYPYHHPTPSSATSTASGVSMRGRRRPIGVSGRGCSSVVATSIVIPTGTNTSSRGGSTAKRILPNPVTLQNAPIFSDKEQQQQKPAQMFTTEQIQPKFEEEEEDDDEYKEEEETDDDEDEEDEEEVKDDDSSSINFLVDESDGIDLIEELQDLLEDYEDDWTLFANKTTNSHHPGIENLERQKNMAENKDLIPSSSEAVDNHVEVITQQKVSSIDSNNICNASVASISSSLDSRKQPPQRTICSNNNKYNYPSVSAPPSPTIHNSTFHCPLDFIRHPQTKHPSQGEPINYDSSKHPKQELDAAASTSASEPTQKQLDQLTHLLDQFYQVLLQQAVITVRHLYLQKQHASGEDPRLLLLDTLSKQPQQQRFTKEGSENLVQDELAEILDGAVGMLQELDALRKNALRNIVAFEEQEKQSALDTPLDQEISNNNSNNPATFQRRVLTRSVFTRALQERYSHRNQQKPQNNKSDCIRAFRTVFDIRGLSRLEDTFKVMDESVVAYKNTLTTTTTPSGDTINILHPRQVCSRNRDFAFKCKSMESTL
jgi:hypothetical protein